MLRLGISVQCVIVRWDVGALSAAFYEVRAVVRCWRFPGAWEGRWALWVTVEALDWSWSCRGGGGVKLSLIMTTLTSHLCHLRFRQPRWYLNMAPEEGLHFPALPSTSFHFQRLHLCFITFHSPAHCHTLFKLVHSTTCSQSDHSLCSRLKGTETYNHLKVYFNLSWIYVLFSNIKHWNIKKNLHLNAKMLKALYYFALSHLGRILANGESASASCECLASQTDMDSLQVLDQYDRPSPIYLQHLAAVRRAIIKAWHFVLMQTEPSEDYHLLKTLHLT